MLIPIAILILIESKGPVFFKQKRNGLNKKEFYCYKFRSMHLNPMAGLEQVQKNDPRITKVGKFIRKTSIDELPQIYQCLFTNHLSLVGPRPALWNQDDLIAERDKYGANDVKPGITGWAQINGRDELEIPVKAKLDGDYVKNIGFAMDCKCFFGTFLSVLRSDGVVEGGTGEMHKKEENK